VAYVTPKAILNNYLAALRAWEGEPLASCIFRKGPQRTVNTTAVEDTICVVALKSLEGGEVSAGSGNNWWHDWAFAVLLMVKDDEAHPGTSEDTRLDLIEQFGQCQQQMSVRTLDGAKVGKITACNLGIGEYFENSTQVFRYAEIVVTYKTLRS